MKSGASGGEGGGGGVGRLSLLFIFILFIHGQIVAAHNIGTNYIYGLRSVC